MHVRRRGGYQWRRRQMHPAANYVQRRPAAVCGVDGETSCILEGRGASACGSVDRMGRRNPSWRKVWNWPSEQQRQKPKSCPLLAVPGSASVPGRVGSPGQWRFMDWWGAEKSGKHGSKLYRPPGDGDAIRAGALEHRRREPRPSESLENRTLRWGTVPASPNMWSTPGHLFVGSRTVNQITARGRQS